MAGADDYFSGLSAYKSGQQQGPYRGGLTTEFGQYDPSNFGGSNRSRGNWAGLVTDSDPDVSNAAQAYYHLNHPDEGTDRNSQAALLNMYKGRIATKNSLAEQMAGNQGQEQTQEDIDRLSAGQTLGQGLKNTRENFNSRGLLYSGKRESGENQVRGGVAGQLAGSLAGTKRDYANSLSASQNAYASVDLANAKEAADLATQAFDTANANNIARLQAMQQLGAGVGGALGTVAGSYNRQQAPSTTTLNGPSGPSYYDTSATNNYYDSPAQQQGLVSRTA